MQDAVERLIGKAGEMADAAVRTGAQLVGKGRDQMDKLALQRRMSKLYRQLGALVYSLRKNGEENEAMIAWYEGEIDRIKAKLAVYELPEEDPVRVQGVYGKTDSGAQEDAMFRGGGGA